MQGNAQCRYRLHIRVPTRQAIGVGSLARNKANSIVRYFPSSRRLTPSQNSLSEMPQPQYTSPMPPEQAPPQHYQIPQQYTGSPNFHAPVQPPAPNRKPSYSVPRIFHYSKCTGRKKAVCVRVFGNSRSYPCAILTLHPFRSESTTRGWPGN
jgi:hypothetical protein